jgi:hypothetical protein
MADGNSTELEGTTKRIFDTHLSFGWEFLKEFWTSRRLVASIVAFGFISGGALGYIMPKKYTIRLELTPSPIEKYDQVFSTLFTQIVYDKGQNVEIKQNFDTRPELKIINDAISQTVYSQQIFFLVIQKSLKRFSKSEADINEVAKIAKLSPGRGLEKYFIQGYSVEFSFKDRDEVIKIAKNYADEFKIHVNANVKTVFGEILEANSKLNTLKFDILRKSFLIDSAKKAEDTQDAIDIARIGGFEKLILPQQMPVTAQIPLQEAVPRYFFGYAVLEQEKKQIDNNASDETKVPGYSAFVSESNRLAAMSDFFGNTDLNLVDVRIFPKVEVKNGLLIKLAVMIATTVFFISIAFLFIALRILGRKIVL